MNDYKLWILVISVVLCTFGQDPCNDARYLELKNVNLDSMSERQYEYFMYKDKLCSEQSINSNKLAQPPIDSFSLSVKIVYGRKNNYDDFTPSNKIFIDDDLIGTNEINIKLPVGKHSISVYPSANIAASKEQMGGYTVITGKKDDNLLSKIFFMCEDHNCDEKDFNINIKSYDKNKMKHQPGLIVFTAWVYSSPDKNSEKLIDLARGTKISLIESSGKYYKIKYNDIEGYIKRVNASIVYNVQKN